MLRPKVSDCKECADIQPLIDAINCKLYKASLDIYNNLAYGLNQKIAAQDLLDLLLYKRILINKYANMVYACDYSIEQIAGKVRLLTAGCNDCVYKEPIITYYLPYCQSYFYWPVTFIQCYNCNQSDIVTHIQDTSLLEYGKYYFHTGRQEIVRIDSLPKCVPGPAPSYVDVTSVRDNCGPVVGCPPTTTTTTTPVSSNIYSNTLFNCGSCGPAGSGSVGFGTNDTQPIVGKYYYYPLANRVIRIDSFNGISVGGSLPYNLSSQANTCAGVVCPPTTTTTTTVQSFAFGFGSGFASSANSCSFGTGQQTWYASVSVLAVGVQLYQNPQLTNPVINAGNSWYKEPSNKTWQINNSGVIVGQFSCP